MGPPLVPRPANQVQNATKVQSTLAIHLEGGGLVVLYELGPGGLLHQPPTGLDLENVCIRYINNFFFSFLILIIIQLQIINFILSSFQ